MRRLCLLAILLATSAPGGAQEQEVRWNCNAREQIDDHLSAYMETLLAEPGAVRRHVDFYVSWAQQPGYMAEQQLSWIGIPVDATRLWKPDRYYFGLVGESTDEQGLITFSSPGVGRIDIAARNVVRSLRPHFNTTAVTIEDASLRTSLWEGADWTAEHRSRQGQGLGSARLLLPAEVVIQPVFARLRAELNRRAADPDRHCRIIPQQTQQELEESLYHYAHPIARPNLEAATPITSIPPPPSPPPR